MMLLPLPYVKTLLNFGNILAACRPARTQPWRTGYPGPTAVPDRTPTVLAKLGSRAALSAPLSVTHTQRRTAARRARRCPGQQVRSHAADCQGAATGFHRGTVPQQEP
eukprot:756810-Hanusia_phi.AAC.1